MPFSCGGFCGAFAVVKTWATSGRFSSRSLAKTWELYCPKQELSRKTEPQQQRLMSAGRTGLESSPGMPMLQQKLNGFTGEFEWVVVSPEESEGDEQQVVSETLAATSYLDMLNDARRNKAFHSAIRKVVKDLSCCHVLDIGYSLKLHKIALSGHIAGTGLLSMMAHRSISLQSNVRDDSSHDGMMLVTACESYLPMFKLATKVLRQNNLESSVQLLHMRSDEIQVGVDIPGRADILVSEILDSELLGEGIIPTLRHAHEQLLKPNARTVPHRATMYGQVIECDFLWRCHDLQGVESESHDGLVLAPSSCGESSYVKSCQYALHVDALPGKLQLLSEPFEAFNLDFYKSPDAHGKFRRSLETIKGGTAHAIVSWWVLQLDEEGLIHYSTAPRWIKDTSDSVHSCSGRSWSDHWKQCVWFLPGRGIRIEQSSHIDVVVSYNETSVQYDLGIPPVKSPMVEKTSSLRLKMIPDRIRMLGDKRRRSIVKSAVEKALRKRDHANCLILDDSLITAVCASSADETNVFALFPGLKTDGLKYLESVADANGFNSEKVSLLQKELRQLTADDFNGKKVDVILAEPYYWTYEHMLPWKQLRVWYERTLLGPLLSENPVIMPCRGVLYGMAFSLPGLWRSRCSLGKVEGFDHSPVNQVLGACGNLPHPLECPILAFPSWQCGEHKALTDPFTLMTFNLCHRVENVTGSAKVPFTNAGACHGIVLWMDWVMDLEDNLVLSTGPSDEQPSCWKQGVKLFRTPLEVDKLQDLHIEAAFDAQSGDISIKIAEG